MNHSLLQYNWALFYIVNFKEEQRSLQKDSHPR